MRPLDRPSQMWPSASQRAKMSSGAERPDGSPALVHAARCPRAPSNRWLARRRRSFMAAQAHVALQLARLATLSHGPPNDYDESGAICFPIDASGAAPWPLGRADSPNGRPVTGQSGRGGGARPSRSQSAARRTAPVRERSRVRARRAHARARTNSRPQPARSHT